MHDTAFQKHEQAEQLKRQDNNARDLQHEISDVETGQQKRFLNTEKSTQATAQRKEREQHTQLMTALETLLTNDAEYAALYRDTMEVITKAEAATESALEAAMIRLDKAQNAMQEMLNDANRLPDGTAIFKDEQGNVWTEHGERVDDPVLLESIVWRDNATTHEEFLAGQKDIDQERHAIDELRRYQIDVLGGARDEMMDEENPVTRERMEEIRDKVQGNTPATVSAINSSPEIVASTSMTAPQNKQMPVF